MIDDRSTRYEIREYACEGVVICKLTFYMYVKILTQKKFHVYMWVLQFHVFLLFFLGGDGIFRNDSYDFNNRIIFCF